jgi:hypothetical protein
MILFLERENLYECDQKWAVEAVDAEVAGYEA